MKASFRKYILQFKRPSGTSRGILTQKETWFLILRESGRYGIGECGLLRGLSTDDVPQYEATLEWTCSNIGLGESGLLKALKDYPSIQFGVEQAFRSLVSDDPFLLFDSDFVQGINAVPINGLVWMGDASFMRHELECRIRDGFDCIKIKIGAIDFKEELRLLSGIRDSRDAGQLTLRVDANGSFRKEEALGKLEQLAEFGIHSIEQPVHPGNRRAMRELCANSPVPIALDEELIGISGIHEKEKLLRDVQPGYIVLKPSLIGGFAGSLEWITLAGKLGIGWWITSALESNIGLNALAQWTATLPNDLPQGLGTGSLYSNNFECPLTVKEGKLFYDKKKDWSPHLIEVLCI